MNATIGSNETKPVSPRFAVDLGKEAFVKRIVVICLTERPDLYMLMNQIFSYDPMGNVVTLPQRAQGISRKIEVLNLLNLCGRQFVTKRVHSMEVTNG